MRHQKQQTKELTVKKSTLVIWQNAEGEEEKDEKGERQRNGTKK